MGKWESESGLGSPAHFPTCSPANYTPRTLRSDLKSRGRLPFDECLQIALKLTEALGHLHQYGLVHRDIKPSNVIFVNGRPKLADIGLVAGTEATLSFVGTEGYLPPEGPGKPPADIYSLGKVIYEISTGRDRNEYPELPSLWKSEEEREGFAELNEVILRACASDLQRRYSSTGPMHEDLVLIQAGKSLRRSRALQRRFQWLSRAAALLTVVTVIIAAGYLLQRHQTRVAKRLTMQLQVQSGIRLMEDGNAPGALLWFAEALTGAERILTAQEKETHRFRLGAVLRECPRLLHALSHEGAGDHVKVTISRDGRRIVTSRYDHAARIWDAETGTLIATLPHLNFVSDAAISLDGRLVATGSRDRTAQVWDAATGSRIGSPLQHEDEVVHVAIGPDGRRVATASYDQTARVWDAATGQPITAPLTHDTPVSWAAFGPDEKRIVTATTAGDLPGLSPAGVEYQAQVWDAETGAKLTPPLTHRGPIFEAAFSPDGGRVMTVSYDGTVKVWNAATSELVVPALRHQQFPQHGEFSPDGRRILIKVYGGGLYLWDATTGEDITPPFENKERIIAATLSPDGRRIAGLHNHQVLVLDAVTGKRLLPPLPHNDQARGLAFSADGLRLVTAAANVDPVVRVWDLSAADIAMPQFTHPGGLNHAQYSLDGRRVLTVNRFGHTAQVWDGATGQPVAPLIPFGGYGDAKFSADGTRVLTLNKGYEGGNGSARVWDAATSEPISPEWKVELQMLGAQFSPDGQRVVISSGASPPRADILAEARVYDAMTGAPLSPPMELESGSGASASFSPDGRKVITGGSMRGKSVQVWDATTAKKILRIELTRQVQGPQFSPDGQKILTTVYGVGLQVWDALTGKPVTAPLRLAATDGKGIFSPDSRLVVGWAMGWGEATQVWDATTGERVGPQLRHQASVSDAAFSPDSRWLVTASADRTAQIWDARTGLKLSPPLKHPGRVISAGFSPDGRRVLTACVDGTARVWEFPCCDWPVEDLRLLAQVLSGRSIDPAGNAVVLAPEVLQADLAKLRSKQPDYFREGTKVAKTTH
ncbi:MAG: hypothetical protein L0Z50_18015 [Verrucomicrobiales bacterium]|nr:hypothetical protein [Verrucomicrobiales bacterium]